MQLIANDTSGKNLSVGIPYIFKMRAKTIGTTTLYSLKVWEQNTNEPSAWTISGYGIAAELKQGSVTFNSHYSNVSFGNVTIESGPFTDDYDLAGNSLQSTYSCSLLRNLNRLDCQKSAI